MTIDLTKRLILIVVSIAIVATFGGWFLAFLVGVAIVAAFAGWYVATFRDNSRATAESKRGNNDQKTKLRLSPLQGCLLMLIVPIGLVGPCGLCGYYLMVSEVYLIDLLGILLLGLSIALAVLSYYFLLIFSLAYKWFSRKRKLQPSEEAF